MRLYLAQQGSAMVEFSIMLPVFLLLIQALMFFGGMGILRVDMARLGALGTQIPDNQSQSDMPRSYFNVFDVSTSIDAEKLKLCYPYKLRSG